MEFYEFGLGCKKFWLFLILINCFSYVYSQLSEPGIPESFLVKTKAAAIIPEKPLDTINISNLLAEDVKYSIPNRYGVVQQVNVNIKNAGIQSLIFGKGYIWQYKITSSNAYSLGIHFTEFSLPKGAKVFIYNESHTQLLGAFTDIDNNSANQLSIAEFKGNNAIVEYFEPFSPGFTGTLTIGYVSQAYKDIQSVLESTTTRIGINCPEGANWQDEKHAVCRMTFSDTQASYYCTGFLINNVRADGTPYFQTANHCISTAAEAASLVTYFNYENSTCTSSDASSTITLSGASLKATNSYSDFSLLLLNQAPPASYIPYYAGWDASGRSPLQGTSIHHPNGTPKCIALDLNAPKSYGYSINWTDDKGKITSTTVANTHWSVQFDQGNVEVGSSGSPLFDDNKRVIGQLHGGDNTESYYGKMSLSWNYSASSNQQLKIWLDPDGTGALTMDGSYMKIKPKSAFTTALTNVCVGVPVNLTDASKYSPTQWYWSISPSSYEYVNGTSSTSKNPQVVFDTVDTYSVSLRATNNYGIDSVSLNNYITAKNSIQVSLSNIPVDSVLCGSVVNKYPIKASGAIQYKFTVEKLDKMDSIVKSDSLYLTLKSGVEKSGSFNSWVKVAGSFGTCKSADSAQLKVVMQTNNNIENAIRLWPGRNALFSNQCATVQTSEPHPPFSGCYTNYSWCNSSGSTTKNTIWFTFLGPSSGRVTIDTHGFNNRIAVYDADSYSKIVSGNIYNYTILAANEGRSATDGTSLIENISVEPGKTYWLQVDGSNGAIGTCTIDLLSNSLELFPNPSNGQFDVIISNVDNGVANVEIYSVIGKLLQKRQLEVTQESNRFSFDLSDFAAGMYVVKVNINGSTMKTKLMIVK